jgi:hypothetical protein
MATVLEPYRGVPRRPKLQLSAMRILIVVAVAVVIAAVAGAVVVWSGSGGEAACDESRLADAIEASISDAERDGRVQISVDMPDACDDADLETALPAVSRSWHVMPGGVLMREPTHGEPG